MSEFERFFAKHPMNVMQRVLGEFDFLHNVYKDYLLTLAKMPKIIEEKLCVLTSRRICVIIMRYEKKKLF